jgi:hypothetical protein
VAWTELVHGHDVAVECNGIGFRYILRLLCCAMIGYAKPGSSSDFLDGLARVFDG